MKIHRETRETRVAAEMVLAGSTIDVRTASRFLRHMLETFARYAGLGLSLEAEGDLQHHVIEDVAITLGTGIHDLVPATAARYAHRVIAMDDALVEVTLDLGGRPYYRGPLPAALYDHWMRSFADHAKCSLHVRVLRGRDRHHVVEAAFKALGLALRDAMVDSGAVFSTKGLVTLRRDDNVVES
jgi:imidazoleglycerol-phosphate dehydratase